MSSKRESPKREESGFLKNRLQFRLLCGSLIVRIQDRHSVTQNPPVLQLASPKRCEHDPQGGCPSEKPDLSDHSLKRSPEKDKQRKWWCEVPVWRERYHGLIRSDTGKLEQHCAVVPPNALFGLWRKHETYDKN